MPQQQLQILSNASTSNPPLSPQFPAQSNPKPNNRGAQWVETLNLPAYSIATMECNELNLWSGRVVNTHTSPIIVEHTDDEVSEPKPRNFAGAIGDELMKTPMEKKPPSQTIVTRG